MNPTTSMAAPALLERTLAETVLAVLFAAAAAAAASIFCLSLSLSFSEL
jgi:hypothetical protein